MHSEQQDTSFFPKIIAFFLTQFHPIPENDEWWGKGFTEWTNVTKAKPLFDGHYQPHLPTDLGFYDLRLKETRHEQIKLAQEYGIDAFCYHYYWFSGKRILNYPLDNMLADKEMPMPFCLCWANENWTRCWDASEQKILLAQKYLPDDDLNFIKGLIPYFNDPRYIRINGAPFFIVYRPTHLPDANKSALIWREYCKNIGIEKIHICAALTHGNQEYIQFGFDSAVEFPPHNATTENIKSQIKYYEPYKGHATLYHTISQYYLDRTYKNSNVFFTVFPSWDNTARRGQRAFTVLNGTPENYEYWLTETIRKTIKNFPNQERFVFINAWNEWAEGCHLEPDRMYQRRFLEATQRAKLGLSQKQNFEDISLTAKLSQSLTQDLAKVLNCHFYLLIEKIKLSLNRFPKLKNVIIHTKNWFET